MTHPSRNRTFKDGRSHYLVARDGCWTWQGACTPRGYGLMRVGAKMVYAHREYYEREVGPIPDGLDLDHLCRNTRCIRPSHQEPVTRAENVRRGLAAKLTADDVRAIRHAVAAGVAQAALARHFAVCASTIGRIVSRATWRDVT